MASAYDQQPASSSLSSENMNDQIGLKRVISAVYCGPTLFDIQNALSLTNRNKNFLHSRMSILEKGLKKTENKYALRIKSSDCGMADDGYKWRKYGQKSIKNSPNPRSYYKCTNPRCGAKKQVERSQEDQDTLIITYEGLHLHYYPYHFNTQLPKQQTTPSFKKAKTDQNKRVHVLQNTRDDDHIDEQQNYYIPEFSLQQGLLEDIVPFTVRTPSNRGEFVLF